MNVRQYLLGSIAVLIFFLIIEWLLHGVILSSCYADYRHLLRPEAQRGWFAIWLVLGYLMFTFGFCFIFVKGYENKGLAEGARYGLYVAFAFVLSFILMGFGMFAMPVDLVLSWIIAYPIIMIMAGIIIAAIYKPKTV
jgi:hypothetical protein